MVALVGLLVALQYVTLAKFAVLPPGAGFVQWSEFCERVAAEVPLDSGDTVLGLALLAMCGALLWSQWRYGQLTQLLFWLTASEARALVGLGIVSACAVRYYFAPGQLAWGGDAAEHILYVKIASEAFAAWEWPIWTNRLAGGSPFLQFYGFLFFYLVAAVDQICGDVFTSIKIVGGIAHALSGPTMYLVVRIATRSRLAGIVAGLAYVLCFWHAQQIAIMGRWPLSLFYLLLPMPFYGFELGRLARYRIPAVAVGGWSLAALAFTHPGYAFWAVFFLAVYIALRCVGYRLRKRGRQWLAVGGAILGLGLLGGAYLTLPMGWERSHTGLADGVSLSGVPDPSWRHLILWSNFRWRFDLLPGDQLHWYGGYLGISLWALALAGLALGRRRLTGPLGAVLVGLSLALIFVLGYRFVVDLPMVASLNAGRYLLFAVFFLAFAAGVGGLAVERKAGPRWLVAGLILLTVDLGATTFQQPYLKRSDSSPIGYPVEMLAEFADPAQESTPGRLPGYRLHPTTDKVHPFSAIGWLVFTTGIPQMNSLFMEAPHAVRLFHDPWRHLFDAELDAMESGSALREHPEYEFIYKGARMQNLRYLLSILPPTPDEPHRHMRMGWRESTPLMVAGRTMPFPAVDFARARSDGTMEQMVRAAFPGRTNIDVLMDVFPALWTMQITEPSPRGLACDVVVLAKGEQGRDLGTNPTAEVLHHIVKNQYVELEVEVDQACFARLAYAYYPYLRITVSGREVPAWPTAGGFIAVELPAGRHKIELVPYLSPLRKTMLGLLVALVGSSGVIIWQWHSRRKVSA